MRSHVSASFLFLLFLFSIGCGGSTNSSPEPGELEQYLNENPEAAKLGGQPEPTGASGPVALPGEEGY